MINALKKDLDLLLCTNCMCFGQLSKLKWWHAYVVYFILSNMRWISGWYNAFFIYLVPSFPSGKDIVPMFTRPVSVGILFSVPNLPFQLLGPALISVICNCTRLIVKPEDTEVSNSIGRGRLRGGVKWAYFVTLHFRGKNPTRTTCPITVRQLRFRRLQLPLSLRSCLPAGWMRAMRNQEKFGYLRGSRFVAGGS